MTEFCRNKIRLSGLPINRYNCVGYLLMATLCDYKEQQTKAIEVIVDNYDHVSEDVKTHVHDSKLLHKMLDKMSRQNTLQAIRESILRRDEENKERKEREKKKQTIVID